MLHHTFVGNADFESILRPVDDMDVSTGIATPSTKKLKKDQKEEHKEININNIYQLLILRSLCLLILILSVRISNFHKEIPTWNRNHWL